MQASRPTLKAYLKKAIEENLQLGVCLNETGHAPSRATQESPKESPKDALASYEILKKPTLDTRALAKSTNIKPKSAIDAIKSLPSPCYLLYKQALDFNLRLLNQVATQSNCRVLVALKGYSFWREFDSVRSYLDGATCSGAWEARLAHEEILSPLPQEEAAKKDICVFSPAYTESNLQEILQYATHLIFNSFNQWQRFRDQLLAFNSNRAAKGKKPVEIGLRLNPLYSEVEVQIYNPCAPKSRLGITPKEFYRGLDEWGRFYGYASQEEFFSREFSGLHFHTLCEQDSSTLERTIERIKAHFAAYLPLAKWINLGGGHHITKDGYDDALLVSLIRNLKKELGVEIFLEPGEAVGWQCGDLIGTVVDIVENDGYVAILDISASCHAPDCLEMPYRADCYKISFEDGGLKGRLEEDLGVGVGRYQYRLGGPTCLAGDVFGDYSFESKLQIGDKIAFCDMLHYTVVKNTTFNGIALPSLCVLKDDTLSLLKSFDYLDFKNRN